jgi:hypothetical protein
MSTGTIQLTTPAAQIAPRSCAGDRIRPRRVGSAPASTMPKVMAGLKRTTTDSVKHPCCGREGDTIAQRNISNRDVGKATTSGGEWFELDTHCMSQEGDLWNGLVSIAWPVLEPKLICRWLRASPSRGQTYWEAIISISQNEFSGVEGWQNRGDHIYRRERRICLSILQPPQRDAFVWWTSLQGS